MTCLEGASGGLDGSPVCFLDRWFRGFPSPKPGRLCRRSGLGASF